MPSRGGGEDATPAASPNAGPTRDSNGPDPAGLVGRRIIVNWRDHGDCAGEVVAWRLRRKDCDNGECEHRVVYDDPSGAWSRRDTDRWHYLRNERWRIESEPVEQPERQPAGDPPADEGDCPLIGGRPSRERREPGRLNYSLGALYEMLLKEEQRAVGIMVDHAEISVAYGFNSPQAKCARNVYAANMAAFAMQGVRLPKLEPLATSILDPSISAPPSEVFD